MLISISTWKFEKNEIIKTFKCTLEKKNNNHIFTRRTFGSLLKKGAIAVNVLLHVHFVDSTISLLLRRHPDRVSGPPLAHEPESHNGVKSILKLQLNLVPVVRFHEITLLYSYFE